MTFSGVNYVAIVIAAIVAWLAGAGWYVALGRTWMAALGWTPERAQAARSEPGAYRPAVIAQRRDLRRALLAWLRDDDDAHQQQLCQARLAPLVD